MEVLIARVVVAMDGWQIEGTNARLECNSGRFVFSGGIVVGRVKDLFVGPTLVALTRIELILGEKVVCVLSLDEVRLRFALSTFYVALRPQHLGLVA